MKLLLVSRSIPMHAGTGGMERVSWDLAKALDSTMSVEVLTTSVPGQPSSFTHEGVQVTTVPNTRPGRYSPAWWIGTARFARAKSFDAVMSVSGGATAMIHCQRGPRYTFQAHGTALGELKNALRVRSRLWPLKVLRYAYWTGLDSFTYRRVDKVVAASEQVAGFLRRWPYAGAWRKTELQVIQNAVDAGFFAHSDARRSQVRLRFAYSSHETVAITVSRLDVQKGVDRVIRAITSRSNRLNLLVGGAGPEAGSLKRISDSRISFLGDLDREGVRDALTAADVFVLPVRNFAREALPLSVLEALSAGLPVIVPLDSNWPADIVPLLHFVDVSDEEALYEAIEIHGGDSSSRVSRLPRGYSLDQWASQYGASQQLVVFESPD